MSISQRLSAEMSALEPFDIENITATDTDLDSLTSGHGITETGASGFMWGQCCNCSSMC